MPNVAKRLVNGAMIILTLVGKISHASTNPCRNTPCKHKLVHVVVVETTSRHRPQCTFPMGTMSTFCLILENWFIKNSETWLSSKLTVVAEY